MTTPRMTFKAMKQIRPLVVGVGYCNLQRLLYPLNRTGYNYTREGWACDCFVLDDNVAVVTGYDYSRACDAKIPYDYAKLWEDKAYECQTSEQALALIQEFAQEVWANNK